MPHIHDQVDFTVETYVVYHNRVLLRKHDKYKIWLAIGGHIELDEDPNQAAVREVREEVGLEVRLLGRIEKYADEGDKYHELIPPKYLNRHRINKTHEHVALVYFAVSQTDVIRQGDTEVSDECRWFAAEELDDPALDIKDSIRKYAKTALIECV